MPIVKLLPQSDSSQHGDACARGGGTRETKCVKQSLNLQAIRERDSGLWFPERRSQSTACKDGVLAPLSERHGGVTAPLLPGRHIFQHCTLCSDANSVPERHVVLHARLSAHVHALTERGAACDAALRSNKAMRTDLRIVTNLHLEYVNVC